MPDQSLAQLRPILKDLNAKMEKLGHTIDELDILAHHYLRLSLSYKELAKQIDHMDAMVFAVRQEFDKVKKTVKQIDG